MGSTPKNTVLTDEAQRQQAREEVLDFLEEHHRSTVESAEADQGHEHH